MLKSPLYDKMPKWVQQDIESLKGEINRLKEENKILLGQAPKSDTRVILPYPKVFYLENYSRVEFKGSHNLKVTVSTHPDGFVRVDLNDGVIIPMARNNVYIVDKFNKLKR